MHTFIRNTFRGARPLALAGLGLAIASALVTSQTAHASSFQLKEDDAQAMGRAYAGSDSAGGDVAVVANAPAAMSLLQGTYFEADVTAINFGATFNGSAHDVLGQPIGGNNGGNAGTTMPVPAFFFETQLNDKWHVGAGFSVPFGFKTQYDNNWVGRYNAIESKFESLDGTLSASYNVTDNLAIGASAIAQRTSATLTNAINTSSAAVLAGAQQAAAQLGQPLTPQLLKALAPTLTSEIYPLVPPGSDGYAHIQGSSWAWGYQVGALWTIDPQDRIDFNYHSKISHRLTGSADFTIPANFAYLLASTGQSQLFQNTQGTADFTTPATAAISYWHQEDKFGFGADVDYTEWDVFKNLTVNYANPAQPPTTQAFDWHNSWYTSFGGEYYLTDQFTVRGGIGFDTTPTSAPTREARVPDETRKLLSFGIGYKATEHFSINASYAHIFVNRAVVANDVSATEDVLTGTYDDYGNLFALSAIYKF